MKSPTYDQITEIMRRTMGEVTMAGHDVKRCVWELSPSIIQTVHNEFVAARQMVDDPEGMRPASFMGIPIRQGVEDESTGILLKMVNLNRWE